jgi:hypothetical protein
MIKSQYMLRALASPWLAMPDAKARQRRKGGSLGATYLMNFAWLIDEKATAWGHP